MKGSSKLGGPAHRVDRRRANHGSERTCSRSSIRDGRGAGGGLASPRRLGTPARKAAYRAHGPRSIRTGTASSQSWARRPLRRERSRRRPRCRPVRPARGASSCRQARLATSSATCRSRNGRPSSGSTARRPSSERPGSSSRGTDPKSRSAFCTRLGQMTTGSDFVWSGSGPVRSSPPRPGGVRSACPRISAAAAPKSRPPFDRPLT